MRVRLPHSMVAAILMILMASASAAAQAPPAPGRLIDIGGLRLHLHCVGHGSPTVVIDGGAGTWSIFYTHVQAALAGETRVCVYDRAGLGWSDAGPLPRTSQRMADELRRLLKAANERPPFLLVGHSLGGYNVRVYQKAYPGEVAGLVLAEAAHEAQWERLPPEWADALRAQVAWLRARAEQARAGKIGVADVKPGAFTAHAPEWRGAHIAAQRTPAYYLGIAAENEGALASAQQVPGGSLGELPLVVLTAERSFDHFAGAGLDVEPANRVWLHLQHELAHLSSNVTRLFSPRDHALHGSDPEALVRAIREGVRMVRARTDRTAGRGMNP